MPAAKSPAVDHAVQGLRKPYLLFLGDATNELWAKTAFGLRDWIPGDIVGQFRLPKCSVDLGIENLAPAEAYRRGARSLVVGIAPAGGQLPEAWIDVLGEAARAGLDIISGLHTRLSEIPALAAAAAAAGVGIHDIRAPRTRFGVGSGRKRSGKRVLTVGADCAIGKKYTALALTREMQRRGWDATFRATGQTGVLIAGGGIVIDAVVADFVSGAAEALSPDAEPDHWDVIEGQGSLFHPSYAGVALGLIHGSQPDAIVLCYELERTEIDSYPGFAIPDIRTAVQRNIEAASLTNPRVRCAGISLNTSRSGAAQSADILARVAREYDLPCMDPRRDGVGAVVDRLASL